MCVEGSHSVEGYAKQPKYFLNQKPLVFKRLSLIIKLHKAVLQNNILQSISNNDHWKVVNKDLIKIITYYKSKKFTQ